MQCIGEIVGLLKECASQLEVIAHPSSTFCSLLNAWPAMNSVLLAQCFEASHKGDLQNLQTSFPPTLSWRENVFHPEIERKEPSGFTSLIWDFTCGLQVPLRYMHWCNLCSTMASSFCGRDSYAVRVRLIEKMPIFLMPGSRKAFTFFHFKTGFSLRWGLGALHGSSLQRCGCTGLLLELVQAFTSSCDNCLSNVI